MTAPRKTWAGKSHALSAALEKPIVEPKRELTVILPMEHPLDHDCPSCEDDRRISLGVRPKDESAYPHFVRGRGMHDFLSRDPVRYSPERAREIQDRTWERIKRLKERW